MLVPLATHQPNYHCTVWYFSPEGCDDPSLVQSMLDVWHAHTNDMALRLTAKHLRLQGHLTAFDALLRSARLRPSDPNPFEHPLVSRLFSSLVLQGDFDAAEAALERAAYGDAPAPPPTPLSRPLQPPPLPLFELAANGAMPRVTWTESVPHDPERVYRPPWPAAPPLAPPGRSGQATALDPTEKVLYLHGGYDGERDLADFWKYDIVKRDWQLISANTAQAPELQAVPGVGMQQVVDLRNSLSQSRGSPYGPGPRARHAMAFDARSGMLYLLGRYVDEAKDVAQLALSEMLYSADTTLADSDVWDRTGTLLHRLHDTIESPDRRRDPPVVTVSEYRSDLWGYNTRTARWTCYSSDVDADGGPPLVFDHQIVADGEGQRLYVFGGHAVCPDRSARGQSLKSDGPWLGLWEHDLVARQWRRLSKSGLLPRAGHVLLLPPRTRGPGRPEPGAHLWIVGGMRGALACDDVWRYDLQTGAAHRVQTLPDPSLGPEAGKPAMGATPSAALDQAQGKLLVLTGQAPARSVRGTVGHAQNELWVLDLSSRIWTRICQAKGLHPQPGSNEEGIHTLADELATTLPGGAVRVNESGAGPGTSFFSARRNNPRASSRSQSIFSAFRTGTIPSHTAATTGRDAEEAEADAPRGKPIGDPDDDIDFGLGPLPSTPSAPISSSSRDRASADPNASMPPRFGQSMAYLSHPDGGELVIFGGQSHAGRTAQRWGDTWHLMLSRFPAPEMLRQARFLIRQRKFTEMLHTPSPNPRETTRAALTYLQSSVADVVDYNSPSDTSIFRDLSAQLLCPPPPATESPAPSTEDGEEDLLSISQVLPDAPPPTPRAGTGVPGIVPLRDKATFAERMRLFQSLLHFFPATPTEPSRDLTLIVSRLALKDA